LAVVFTLPSTVSTGVHFSASYWSTTDNMWKFRCLAWVFTRYIMLAMTDKA